MTTSYNKHVTYDVITHRRAAEVDRGRGRGGEKKNANGVSHVLNFIKYEQ